MIKYALSERLSHNHELIRGLSCDEDGVFLAGNVPLIYRGSTASTESFLRAASELRTRNFTGCSLRR
jgi:hypothetical protein